MTRRGYGDGISRNVGNLIREKRSTVTAVARTIDIPRSTLSGRLVAGTLTVDDVVKIAEHLGARDRIVELFTVPEKRHLSAV